MADEIYVNIGTTFQQPYQAVTPANGRTPVNAQQPRQAIANAQTPFTYQNRQPHIYRNPVNSQTPYIANAQQPYPFIANANYPFIANAQTPYPYIANAQSPYIANARQPSTYARQGQTPFTYVRQGRTPFTYQNRQPVTYERQGQLNYQHQQPYIYQSTTDNTGQSPYIANARQPAEYNLRTPSIYQNPVSGQSPYIANAQQPYPYIANSQTTARQPAQIVYPYIANARQPSTYNVQNVAQQPAIGRVPFTYQNRQPSEYVYQHAYQTQYRIPYTFNYQVVSQETRTGTLFTQSQIPTTGQSPYITRTPVSQPYTYSGLVQTMYFFLGTYGPGAYAYDPYLGYSNSQVIAYGNPIGYDLNHPSSNIPSGVLPNYNNQMGPNWSFVPTIGPTSSHAGQVMFWRVQANPTSTTPWTFSFTSGVPSPNSLDKLSDFDHLRFYVPSVSPTAYAKVPLAPVAAGANTIQFPSGTFTSGIINPSTPTFATSLPLASGMMVQVQLWD